eukprot:g635.t1
MQLNTRGVIITCVIFATFSALGIWTTQNRVTSTDESFWSFGPRLRTRTEPFKTQQVADARDSSSVEKEPIVENPPSDKNTSLVKEKSVTEKQSPVKKKPPVYLPYVKTHVINTSTNKTKENKVRKSRTKKSPTAQQHLDFRPEVKHFEGSKDIPQAKFHLHLFGELKLAYSTICSPCKSEFCEKCELFSKYKDQFNKTHANLQDATLHIIPLDPFAWMSSMKEHHGRAWRLQMRMIKFLHSTEPFMRYNGADHVFLCLTKECSDFAAKFIMKLSASLGTRVIFAGVNVIIKRLQWPCPYRILSLRDSILPNVNNTVLKIVNETSYMIHDSNRWVCADKKHPPNHWYKQDPEKFVSGTVMHEYGFLLCSIPKCGSTMIKMLLRRMMHKKNWREIGNGIIHGPWKNGLVTVNPKKKFELTRAIFEDPSYIKGAIVRNPAARLLSGYLDKIVRVKQYNRVPGLGAVAKRAGRIPTFAELVEVLVKKHPNNDRLDHHFRAQSSFCGFRNYRFDFLGELENMGDDFIVFAKSMHFWEKYGANGWGKNQTGPFVHASAYRYEAHHSESQIWEYYTEELLMKVYKYYKEDFIRFGYSIHELLASKPENLTAHQLK